MTEPRLTSQDLALLCLRIGLGVLLIVYGWPRISHPAAAAAVWQQLHLPLPGILGPVQAVLEFCGGILLAVGLFTRLWGFLFAVDMLGAFFIVKIPAATFTGGWALEWQALWIALALLVGGAGSISLDGLLRSIRTRDRTRLA